MYYQVVADLMVRTEGEKRCSSEATVCQVRGAVRCLTRSVWTQSSSNDDVVWYGKGLGILSSELIKSTASLFSCDRPKRNEGSYTQSVMRTTITLKIYVYRADSNNESC
jgi:hypothetical protein